MTAVPAPAGRGLVVTAPAAPATGRSAVPGGRWLTAGYALAAVLCAGAAWWLARHGVATDVWPSFAPQDPDGTSITRYSGAWLTAAAGAALAAALLVVTVVRRIVRERAPRAVAAAAAR